jgi:hypothetical protein
VTPRYLTGNTLQPGPVRSNDITVLGTRAKTLARITDVQEPGTANICGTVTGHRSPLLNIP